MTQLTYSDASEVLYGDSESGLVLTPQQQSLAVQAVAVFLSPYNWSDYTDYSDDIDAWVAETIAALTETEVPPPMNGNNEVNLWGIDAEPVGGSSAITRSVLTTQYHNFVVAPTTPAINWKVRWDRYLAAGQWEYAFLWRRVSNAGIIDFYATPDSGGTVVVIDNLDLRGTTLDNQRTIGSFTLTKSELYHLELEVVATSLGSNYNAVFTAMQLWKVGD